MKRMQLQRVAVIGGGTGTFITLTGLKKYPIDLGVVVAMTDSGGSTGRLRDQYGVLPPGDLRQCLVALSQSDEIWRELFLYRFDKGDFAGHNFGNILLSVLEKISPNYREVIKRASTILNVKGSIFPVTVRKTNLKAKYESGKVIKGEALIDKDNHFGRVISLSLTPPSIANPNAVKRLKNSDFVVIGPGDLYTSLIPCLLPHGIVKALSKLKIIFVANLMNKSGQTDGFTLTGHVSEIEKYLNRPVNKIIVNNATLPQKAVLYYQKYKEDPVLDDLKADRRVVREDLLSYSQYKNKKGDMLKRSLLRHDPEKLAKAIFKLM